MRLQPPLRLIPRLRLRLPSLRLRLLSVCREHLRFRLLPPWSRASRAQPEKQQRGMCHEDNFDQGREERRWLGARARARCRVVSPVARGGVARRCRAVSPEAVSGSVLREEMAGAVLGGVASPPVYDLGFRV